jgi:hypothetical protein
MVMNIWVPLKVETFLKAEQLLAPQEGLSPMKVS